MGKERFRGESAPNLEPKCLCVLVMDVSGSMEPCMAELNTALKSFFKDIEECRGGVPENTIDQLEICVMAFDEEVKVLRNPCLLEDGEVPKTLKCRGSVTCSVDALKAAIQMVQDRKEFYKDTNQPYYRPWIVFMTDGEPYPYNEAEIAAFEKQVAYDTSDKAKKYMIMGIGVGDDISDKTLKRLTAGHARNLRGTSFGSFFKWLSASVSTITSSKPGQKVNLNPGNSEWGKPFDEEVEL